MGFTPLPWTLRTPHAPPCCSPGLSHLRRLGLVYFLYLFLFSGLEFTLSFLAHQRFQFSRWACSPAKDPARGPPASRPGSCPATFPRAPPRTLGQDGCWWWSRAGCHLQGCGTDHPAPPSLQQGKMFFFIGLTMATIQGTYTRRISPGREIRAVKQVCRLPQKQGTEGTLGSAGSSRGGS